MKNNLDKIEIYISYAWGDKSEADKNRHDIVSNIYKTFREKGYNIIIDKDEVRYKESIRKFMQRLGKGKYIIAVISRKYLESKNCMFEVLEMLKYPNFRDRIFPIVLEDAKIFNAIHHVDYINYWQHKIDELNNKANSIKNKGYAASVFEEIKLFNEIHRIISDFSALLSDMYVLKPEIHRNSNFKALFDAIDAKIEEDKKDSINMKNKDPESKPAHISGFYLIIVAIIGAIVSIVGIYFGTQNKEPAENLYTVNSDTLQTSKVMTKDKLNKGTGSSVSGNLSDKHQNRIQQSQQHKVESSLDTTSKSLSAIYFEVTLFVPSRMKDATIFVDDQPAQVIEDLPTLKTIRVKEKNSNSKITARKGDFICSKELFIRQSGLTITLCE